MAATHLERYGASWPLFPSVSDAANDLLIEMACIKNGGTWTHNGRTCGQGLSHHYEAMRRLLWPHLDSHRWSDLCRDEILKNRVTVIMGPASSGKTHTPSWVYLCEYFCFPQDTLVLISSTHIDGLRLRVWAEMTSLWQQAVDQFDFLPGHLLDSKLLISTDSLSEDQFDEKHVRDWRKGIKGIPCIQNGKFVGLGKYAGIKQKNIRLIADEAQFMGGSFLSAFANLEKNGDFRATILGNPNEMLDPLGRAGEPEGGWDSQMEPGKTTVWNTKFRGGRCVNLVGTDSPNFDYPADQPIRYKYLISRKTIDDTASFFGKDSIEYYSQCVGVMKIGAMARRVINRDMCRQFGAFADVIWKGTPIVKIYALDAAYGGDRCVGGVIEFGEDINGKIILSIRKPWIIPIRVTANKTPEDQIAERVKADCLAAGISPENMFHDATGRGSLGTALARVWSAHTNPVEFGGSPSDRPVSLDMFVHDPERHARRLKRCDEHYSKFVTELWFTVRYAIEGGHVRNLPEDVMEEGCMREWTRVRGDRIEIETKEDMKERVGRSPDLFDWLAIAVEGARRRGFNIARLASAEADSANLDWLEKYQTAARKRRERFALNHAA